MGEECVQGFGGKNHKEIVHLKDQGVDGMISEWILGKLGECKVDPE
jgi:hypothetical protein